jgi:hypothetical protein
MILRAGLSVVLPSPSTSPKGGVNPHGSILIALWVFKPYGLSPAATSHAAEVHNRDASGRDQLRRLWWSRPVKEGLKT